MASNPLWDSDWQATAPSAAGQNLMNQEIAHLEQEVDPLAVDSLPQLHARLVHTQDQLARALEEVKQVQALPDDANDEAAQRAAAAGGPKTEELDEEELSHLSKAQREAAIKRARNREAARRSRQRKNERITQLTREVRVLQQENVLVLKCIEELTQKAITAKQEQREMKEELAQLAAQPPQQQQQQQQQEETISPDPTPMLEESPSLEHLLRAEAAAMTAEEEAEDAANAAATAVAARAASHVAALPSLSGLEDLQRGGAHLTARSAASGMMSARGAAVGEHMALLSKENSPRDEDGNPTTAAGAGQQPASDGGGAAAAAGAAVATEATPRKDSSAPRSAGGGAGGSGGVAHSTVAHFFTK